MTYKVEIRTKYYNGAAVVAFGRYRNGALALQLLDPETGECIASPTVNMQDYPEATHPGREQIWVKDYSESEGMPKALMDAGIVKTEGAELFRNLNNCVFRLCDLTEESVKHLNAQN